MSEYDLSTAELIANSPGFRASVAHLRDEVKLGEAWRNIFDGKGQREEAQAALVDLLIETEYFAVAPANATGDMLQRREGKREAMARILFLLDLPSSYITKLRRDALDVLQKLEERAQNG